LTGGIATGKSHVRAQLEERGVPTIDSDTLARAAVGPGTPGLSLVVERFGSGILDADSHLDRRALGAIVFADPTARRDLEAIIHPAVRAATERWFSSLNPARYAFAVADIPLLFETARDREFDAVILTTCSPDVQLQRVMRRDGLSEDEAHQRIAAQMSTDEKAAKATFVIDTNGSVEETNRQVEQVWRELVGRW
jgi:dephospho-CoA kinase